MSELGGEEGHAGIVKDARKRPRFLGLAAWQWRAILLLGLMAVLWVSLPKITDTVADASFGHALPSIDHETAVTAWSPAWSDIEWGSLAGRGEGLDCSISPAALAMFARTPPETTDQAAASINLQFRQACVAHDLCYRHGAATYGYTQIQCDAALVASAFRLCKQIYEEKKGADAKATDANDSKTQAWCTTQARKVLGGVTLGGTKSFRRRYVDLGEDVKGGDDFAYSTIAEYDPYPLGSANYVVPRILTGPCIGYPDTPILITFAHRPGGSFYRARCFDGHSFVTVDATGAPSRVEAEAIPSEYERSISPPTITRGTGSARLVQWCRTVGGKSPTGGVIVRHENPLRLTGCPQGDRAELDIDSATPVSVTGPVAARFPLMGVSQTDLRLMGAGAYLDAVAQTASTSDRAGAPPQSIGKAPPAKALKAKSLDLCQEKLGVEKVRCKLALPRICEAVGPIDRYRWYASPPLVEARKTGTSVSLFSRGCDADGDYQLLQSRSWRFAASGWLGPDKGEASYWRLPETAEPFVALPSDAAAVPAGLVSVTATRTDGVVAREKWGSRILFASAALCLFGLLTLLGFDHPSAIVGGSACLLAAIGALAYVAITGPVANGGFTGDGAISVYRPSSDRAAATSDPTPVKGGRAWLQQRMMVVRDKTGALLVIMPRYFGPGPGQMSVDLQIGRVTPDGRTTVHPVAAELLPAWARPQDVSTLMMTPFRSRNGALSLLIMDSACGANQIILSRTDDESGAAFRPAFAIVGQSSAPKGTCPQR